MYTIKKIIDNQKKFKNLIRSSLKSDMSKARSDLMSIKTEDEYIIKQKNKLKIGMSAKKTNKEIDRLFFAHSKRNDKFYAWWDDNEKTALILTYEKK